jgi:plasmid stability protein
MVHMLICMRTTLHLDDDLMAEVKALAARRHRTMTSVVEESLRRLLADALQPPQRRRVKLPVSTRTGGPRPGVDLNNNAALQDLLDEDELKLDVSG